MSSSLHEQERLRTLREYNIMDSLPEKDYDDITTLASQICGTRVSLISLLNDDKQWFKSAVGTDVKETPIEYAFCTHTVQNPNDLLVVNDVRKDARFANNPLVTGDPHVVFYAGMPLVVEGGYALGSLCVIDTEERQLSDFQLSALRILARQVVRLMQLKKQNSTQAHLITALEERGAELENELRYIRNHATSQQKP